MLVPISFEELDFSKMIEFRITSVNELYDPDEIITNWNVTIFKEDFIEIQFYFTNDEKYISAATEFDRLSMKILDSAYFLSGESFKTMELGTSDFLEMDIPLQMEESSSMKALRKAG